MGAVDNRAFVFLSFGVSCNRIDNAITNTCDTFTTKAYYYRYDTVLTLCVALCCICFRRSLQLLLCEATRLTAMEIDVFITLTMVRYSQHIPNNKMVHLPCMVGLLQW